MSVIGYKTLFEMEKVLVKTVIIVQTLTFLVRLHIHVGLMSRVMRKRKKKKTIFTALIIRTNHNVGVKKHSYDFVKFKRMKLNNKVYRDLIYDKLN